MDRSSRYEDDFDDSRSDDQVIDQGRGESAFGERHCLTCRMRQLLERDKVGAATGKRKTLARRQNLEEGDPSWTY